MMTVNTDDDKIVNMLVNTEFVTQTTIEGAGKENVPEFLLTRFLADNGTTHLDEIKENVDHPLAAVALKNLLSVELVEENNDNYKLSEDAIGKLS